MNLREWALPFYTILVQMAYGTFFYLWVWRLWSSRQYPTASINRISLYPMAVIVITLFVGMFGAHFHLSSPFLSFLAMMNLSQSWLSREILFSTTFSILTFVILWLITFNNKKWENWLNWLWFFSILVGFSLILSMSNIYLLPAQIAWNSVSTHFYFFSTSFLLGGVTLVCLFLLELQFAELKSLPEIDLRETSIGAWVGRIFIHSMVLIVIGAIVLIWQLQQLSSGNQYAQTSFQLFTGVYFPLLVIKFIFALIGLIILGNSSYIFFMGKVRLSSLLQPVTISCLLILISEILGRFIFYATHIRIGV